MLPPPPWLRVRRHYLHSLLTPPPGRPAAGFLQRHQESECRILELQVAEHVPVLADIRLQIRERVAQRDDAAGGNGVAGRERTEGNQAQTGGPL